MSESSTQILDSAHHEELVNGLYNQMKKILDSSEQPIFIYLDDNHKICNQRFAAFLGYKSATRLGKNIWFSRNLC